MKAFIGRSLSGRTPGERGDKGSLQGMRGGERSYSQGRRPSRVFSYKEKSAGYSNGLVSKGSVSVSDWTRLPDLSSRPFCYRTRGVGSLWLLPAEWGLRGVRCGRDDGGAPAVNFVAKRLLEALGTPDATPSTGHGVEPLFDKGQKPI